MADGRSDQTETTSQRVVLTRRNLVRTTAWAVPVVVVASAAPALAVSGLTPGFNPSSGVLNATQQDTVSSFKTQLADAAGTSVDNTAVTVTITGSDTSWVSLTPAGNTTTTALSTDASGNLSVALYYNTATKPGIGTNVAVTASYGSASATWTVTYDGYAIVVERMGDGSATLSSAATAVFLDQFDEAAQSHGVLKAFATTGTSAFTDSGSATSEGMLTLSTDGKRLAVPGYLAAIPTTGVVASSSPRAVSLISNSGSITATDTMTGGYTGNNLRSAASDGTNVWTAGNGSGSTGGIWYYGGSPVQVCATTTNTRAVAIYGGNLYYSTQSGGVLGIWQVGTGLPTTSGQTATNLITTGASTSTTSPYAFVLLSVTDPLLAVGINTAYIADDNSVATSGGVQKWTLGSGAGAAWTKVATYNSTSVSSGNFRGLTGYVDSAGKVILFATDTAAAGNKLIRLVDDHGTFSATLIATAAANTAFRGVALAPTA